MATRSTAGIYRLLFEANAQPLWVYERPSLRFIAVNAAAAARYGYSREAFRRMRVTDLIVETDARRFREFIGASRRSRERVGLWRHRVQGGRVIDVEVVSKPLDLPGARAVLESLHDITGRRRAEEEKAQFLACEQAARAEAEAANRAKNEFLAVISHELRTPMTAMLGWMWLLRSKTLDEDGKARALDIIERNMHQQTQIIEDILDVSSIVTGKLHLEPRRVRLQPIVEAALDVVRPAAEAKAIRVEADLDDDADPVLGDPNRLQQIAWNLLSNAIKFTPDNGRVGIRLRQAAKRVELEVADSGQGIGSEFLPYLFDRFRQEESPITRTHRGLGLGLSLVRDLVQLHGGTVRASSAGVGKGATFTVSLPVTAERPARPEPGAPAVKKAAPESLPTLRGVRVLVVDDEPDTLEMLTHVLEKCGAHVTAVGSAREALSTLKSVKPDVLVSDIAMPGEDGYDLIRKVRSLPPEEGGGVSAAALTACVRVEDRTQALSAGYQIYIPKPVDPAELAAVVRNLSGRSWKT